MGITDRVTGFTSKVQDGAKSATQTVFLTSLRLISGAVLGLSLGLIVREMAQGGFLVLLFTLLVVLGSFMKLSSQWTLGKIFIFDLICVLVGMLLRMYIVIAP